VTPLLRVSDRGGAESDVEVARELVEALVSAGITISETLASLLEDLPDGAFPGEDKAEVLLDMGTCAPLVDRVGQPRCAAAIELAAEVRRRLLDDLRAAAASARADEASWHQ
jgi:hypothetical protein